MDHSSRPKVDDEECAYLAEENIIGLASPGTDQVLLGDGQGTARQSSSSPEKTGCGWRLGEGQPEGYRSRHAHEP